MCCAGLNVWQSPIWRCVAPQQRVRLSNCNYQFTYSLYIRLRLLSRTYKCGRQINVRNWDIDLLLLLQSHSVVPPPSAVQSTCSPSIIRCQVKCAELRRVYFLPFWVFHHVCPVWQWACVVPETRHEGSHNQHLQSDPRGQNIVHLASSRVYVSHVLVASNLQLFVSFICFFHH